MPVIIDVDVGGGPYKKGGDIVYLILALIPDEPQVSGVKQIFGVHVIPRAQSDLADQIVPEVFSDWDIRHRSPPGIDYRSGWLTPLQNYISGPH